MCKQMENVTGEAPGIVRETACFCKRKNGAFSVPVPSKRTFPKGPGTACFGIIARPHTCTEDGASGVHPVPGKQVLGPACFLGIAHALSCIKSAQKIHVSVFDGKIKKLEITCNVVRIGGLWQHNAAFL